MYVVIAGGGAIGEELARRLRNLNVDVTVIDIDPKVCEDLKHHLDANIINGDATRTSTLTKAKVHEADVFLALTGNDDVNIVASMIARQLGAKRVIVRVEKPTFIEVCNLIKLGEVFRPAQITATRIAGRLMGLYLTDLLSLSEKYLDVEAVDVNSKPELAGKRIGELIKELPGNVHIALVMQGSKPIIPKHDLELKSGMRVIMVKLRGG
mgnify:CR=1 FL=1